MARNSQRLPLILVGTGLAVLMLGPLSRPALALTPQSPEVKAAVAKAVTYLRSCNEARPGGRALVGLTLTKCDVPAADPKIVEAVKSVQSELGRSKLSFGETYTPSVFAIFLIELDPRRYAREIQTLLDYLESVQKPHGGWGYPTGHKDGKTSDTSMTQYAMLAMWEADQAGFQVSTATIERAVLWLAKTQDPSGSFGYQGIISNDYPSLVPQTGTSVSLAAAGLGAVYMGAHLLGLSGTVEDDNDGLPPAMRKVASKQERRRRTSLDPRIVRTIQGRGNPWLAKSFTFNVGDFKYYLFYSYERYWSFREWTEKGSKTDWYTPVARHLLGSQREDGSWSGHLGSPIETSFSVLFLIRSMKKSIQKVQDYGAGTLVGGRGLPKVTDLVQVRQGKVVASVELSGLAKMLDAIDDLDDPSFAEAVGSLAELSAEEAKPLVSQHAQKLRELAGGTAADDRLAAVKALAKAGTLNDVPTLIYVLSDPDPVIVREARDGLRRISRKFGGFGLSDEPDPGELLAAVKQWKQWFLAIRPDAEFDD